MQALRLTVNSESESYIFKDWQIKALALIPNDDIDPIGSRFVWEQTNNYLKKEMGEYTQSISRASVINFLEMLRIRGLLRGELTTGKGGHRYEYAYIQDRDHFNDHVSKMLIASLVKEYPDVNMMMVARVAMSEIKDQN